jgi:hypothetical protein
MAASVDVSIIVELMGLGRYQNFVSKGSSGTVPTAATYNYRKLAAGGTAEALDLGDVAVETVLVIRAIDYDLDVDLDNDAGNSAGHDADFTLKAGKCAAVIPNPSGNIWVKNTTGVETPLYEYLLTGTT